MTRPDPVHDLLAAAVPALHARACARAQALARAGEDMLERAWSDLAAAARELMPAELPPMSRAKSSSAGGGL